MAEKKKPIRILMAKAGLDGHDRGVKYVAHVLRDAGYEVIYTGIRRSPEQIVATAIQEDASAIGLSFLSGAHLALTKRVLSLLKEKKAEDIFVFAGGVIPSGDIRIMKEMGVKAVFTPGAFAEDIVRVVGEFFSEEAGSPDEET